MSRRKINLDLVDVEKRETRLGTIVAWNESAENLVKASEYERRGKGGKRDVQDVEMVVDYVQMQVLFLKELLVVLRWFLVRLEWL